MRHALYVHRTRTARRTWCAARGAIKFSKLFNVCSSNDPATGFDRLELS